MQIKSLYLRFKTRNNEESRPLAAFFLLVTGVGAAILSGTAVTGQ